MQFILGGSFSKTFSPGVRLGYLYTTIPVVIEKVWNIKLATNSHTSTFPQVLVAEFFKRGYFEKHREMVSELYRERRDAMVESVAKYFPEGTKCTNPDGGLFCWVEVPGFDTSLLQEKALKDPDIKVAFLPGEKFFAKDGDILQKDCMRLSYGNVEVEDIWIGIEKLAKLYK